MLHELHQAVRAGAVGRHLRAQVGLALAGAAHAGGKLADEVVVEAGGLDHHALLVERARVRGHAAGGAPAHVGVVRAAGREPEQRARV